MEAFAADFHAGRKRRVVSLAALATVFKSSTATAVCLGFGGHEAITRIWPGRSAGAEFFLRSMERFREQLIAGGATTAEGFDSMLASLSDPTFAFVDALSVAAWGRRPA